MTPAQYRLHRCATMRAAMRASAMFLRLPCGAAVSSSWDRAPGVAAHPGTYSSGQLSS